MGALGYSEPVGRADGRGFLAGAEALAPGRAGFAGGAGFFANCRMKPRMTLVTPIKTKSTPPG
jgi:hypothetical protein